MTIETIVAAIIAIYCVGAGLFTLWDYGRNNTVRLGDAIGIMILGGFIVIMTLASRVRDHLLPTIDINPVLYRPEPKDFL